VQPTLEGSVVQRCLEPVNHSHARIGQSRGLRSRRSACRARVTCARSVMPRAYTCSVSAEVIDAISALTEVQSACKRAVYSSGVSLAACGKPLRRPHTNRP